MTTAEAAKIKGVHRQIVIDAIERGALNAVKFGRDWNVLDDERLRAWIPARTPSEKARSRWAKKHAQQRVTMRKVK